MKSSAPKRSADLPPHSVRLVVDPDAKATLTEVQWRWGAGPDEHVTWQPAVAQEADSLRALVLAMLAAQLWHDIPAELESLGTMSVGMKRGWWELRPTWADDTFLKTLANACESASSGKEPAPVSTAKNSKDERAPLEKLLDALPDFGSWWEASRGKGKPVRACFRTKNPNAAGASARPALLFRRHKDPGDLDDPSALLALARELEEHAGGKWVPLFTKPRITREERCELPPLRPRLAPGREAEEFVQLMHALVHHEARRKGCKPLPVASPWMPTDTGFSTTIEGRFEGLESAISVSAIWQGDGDPHLGDAENIHVTYRGLMESDERVKHWVFLTPDKRISKQ